MKNLELQILLIISCVIIADRQYAQPSIEIDQVLTIKDAHIPCPQAGTIRYNIETNDFEGWNGFYWQSLTGYQFYTGEVMDIDSNRYKTVEIDGKMWMAENLRTTRYRDGSTIPEVALDSLWKNANYGAWCKYGDLPSMELVYGKLYNWFVVQDTRGICPEGWHVPAANEWDEMNINMHELDHKDVRLGLWRHYLVKNESGFTALPAGQRFYLGFYAGLEEQANFWSSTDHNLNNAVYFQLEYYSIYFEEHNWLKKSGYSIRCVQDVNN